MAEHRLPVSQARDPRVPWGMVKYEPIYFPGRGREEKVGGNIQFVPDTFISHFIFMGTPVLDMSIHSYFSLFFCCGKIYITSK